MKIETSVQVQRLGQSGFRFEADGFVAYIDPYLSNHVAECEGEHLRRLIPVPVLPEDIRDAQLVMITHAHLDHCDPKTLGPIAASSPSCRFMGPREVLDVLRSGLGLPEDRLLPSTTSWTQLHPSFRVRCVPAAHRSIEPDAEGGWRCVGYVFDIAGKRIYHSGDCSVAPEISEALRLLAPIHAAFLPVNECNYYREQAGIIGNMSVREAFGLASELRVPTVVPMHYDMFEPNCVYREEIQVVYDKSRPSFELLFDPRRI